MKVYALKMAAATLFLCMSCTTASDHQESYEYEGFYTNLKKVVQSDGVYFINDISQRENKK